MSPPFCATIGLVLFFSSTNDADNTLNALISAGANAPVVTVHYGPYMN